MSRIRTLKPEWLDDEPLVALSSDARVLSAALIVLADDYGNGRGGELYLTSRVFPGKSRETLAKALEELASIRYVDVYEVDGQRYFSIRNWKKHQRVDHPGRPIVPAKPEVSRDPRESLAKVPESLGPDRDRDRDQDPEGKGGDLDRARGAQQTPPKDWFGDSFASKYPEEGIEATELHRQLCAKRGLDIENEVGKHRAWANANKRLCLDWAADLELWIRNTRPQKQKTPSDIGGPSDDWKTDRDVSLRERIRSGEFGQKLKAKLEAGQLDASLARRLIAEREQKRAETRPANENAPERNLVSLTANLGRGPQ